ncbi:glycosyltransferase [Desulfosporosinus sp. HMP52]|uniref:glycosyltransferase n=1 Tax=Desulfosporosinus sp. HMP52 TaxID=1487923 RepID=UPI0006899680|nr:glycosyltransferase [Desulfosporosinus sp. HMP52]
MIQRRTTVAAIVVTYNRKELLLECLKALLDQSYSVQQIYVVNNNSTDGTLEHLKNHGFIHNEKVEVINLYENTGGAGGFHHGLKKAKEDEYDWYWLMDDDCLPDSKCLENLLDSGQGDYLSPLVIAKEDGRTSIWWPNIEFDSGVLPVSSVPFNGALIKHSVVELQGLPMQELFIFGDDVEYSFRARRNNFSLYVNTKAILYHPMNNCDIVSAFFNRLKVPIYNSKIKHYCYLRNNIYLSLEYRLLGFNFNKQVIKEIYYSLFINRKDVGIVFWAILHGFKRDLSQTGKFLKT